MVGWVDRGRRQTTVRQPDSSIDKSNTGALVGHSTDTPLADIGATSANGIDADARHNTTDDQGDDGSSVVGDLPKTYWGILVVGD